MALQWGHMIDNNPREEGSVGLGKYSYLPQQTSPLQPSNTSPTSFMVDRRFVWILVGSLNHRVAMNHNQVNQVLMESQREVQVTIRVLP